MPIISYDSHEIGSCEKNIKDFNDFVETVKEVLSKNITPAFVIEINAEEYGVLNLGIYKDMGFLSHLPKNSLPPYMISLNKEFDKQFPNNLDVVELDYFGEPTEFYLKTFIPITLSLEGVKIFWEEGILSQKINWMQE
jgi:hypothetical protein